MSLREQVGIGVIAGIALSDGGSSVGKVVAAVKLKVEVDRWRDVIAGIAQKGGGGLVWKVVAGDEVKVEVDRW